MTPRKQTSRVRAAQERAKGHAKAVAKKVAAQLDEKSGTKVILTVDSAELQRVAQGACGRLAGLSGVNARERLYLDGWKSHRDTTRPGWPRIWTCPECRKPEAAATREPSGMVQDSVAMISILSSVDPQASAHGRQKLRKDIERLIRVDRPLAVTILSAIIKTISPQAARHWIKIMVESEIESRS